MPRSNQPKHKINEMIQAKNVRVTGEGIESRVVPIEEALSIARDKGKDLVEINSTASDPVCRVVDYSKYLYEQKQKEKERERNSAKNVTKEIRFGPNTNDHDLEFKTRHAINFLKEGATVKATVYFKGRTIMYKDKGLELLLKLSQALEGIGKPTKLPVTEDRNMFMIFMPIKK